MDLKDTIIKQLSAPVKRKGTQEYMTDEDGNIVTSEAAPAWNSKTVSGAAAGTGSTGSAPCLADC